MMHSTQFFHVVENSAINPGDVVEIRLFLSGYGKVARNRMVISHSHENILDAESGYFKGEHSGYVQTSVVQVSNERTNNLAPFTANSDAIQKVPIALSTTFIGLSEGFFFPDPIHAPPNSDFPSLTGESMHNTEDSQRLPPILIKFKTHEEVSPGDYTTNIIFTYMVNGNIKQAREKVTIHVRNRYERNQLRLTLIGIYVSVFIVTASLTGSPVLTIILPGLGALLIGFLSRYTAVFDRLFP